VETAEYMYEFSIDRFTELEDSNGTMPCCSGIPLQWPSNRRWAKEAVGY